MNSKKFSEAMGELDTKYVEKAMNYQAKNNIKKRWKYLKLPKLGKYLLCPML